LNDIKKYEDKLLDIDQEIVNEKPLDISWFDSRTPQMIGINEVAKEDLIKIPLMHGFGFNIVSNIGIINSNYYYISVFNPVIDYVYKLGQVFYKSLDKSKTRMMNNTFIKEGNFSLNILYISKKENVTTGDDEMSFVENIQPNIIARVLPQMIYDEKRFNITKHQNDVKNVINKVILMKNTNPVVNKIITKYISVIKRIRYDLFNNLNKNSSMERISVIFDNPSDSKVELNKKLKSILLDPSYLINIQTGGNFDYDNNFKYNSYIKDLIANITFTEKLNY
jgi:hypothetical protein